MRARARNSIELAKQTTRLQERERSRFGREPAEMSNTSVAIAEGETRQAMIRVWMAISAIWVFFWLCIAALILGTGEMSGPLTSQLRLFALIVLTPPIALLTLGALCRCAFELIFQRRCRA
jgi:hypothetical protein